MTIVTEKLFVGKKLVGKVKDGVLCKSIKGSKHLLRYPPAIALSAETLTQAIHAGAKSISVTDTETGRIYTCDIAHFVRYAFELQRRNYEPQKALSLERWDVTFTDIHHAPHNETVTESRAHDTAVQASFMGAGWGKVSHD